MENHIFSIDGVGGVRNLNTCVLDFCLGSDQHEFMAVFPVFNLWIGPGFIF
jgi:hypothetical protein